MKDVKITEGKNLKHDRVKNHYLKKTREDKVDDVVDSTGLALHPIRQQHNHLHQLPDELTVVQD